MSRGKSTNQRSESTEIFFALYLERNSLNETLAGGFVSFDVPTVIYLRSSENRRTWEEFSSFTDSPSSACPNVQGWICYQKVCAAEDFALYGPSFLGPLTLLGK